MIESLSVDQLSSYVDNDLAQKTEVKLNNPVDEISKNEKRAYYFNYMAYSLF